MEKKKREERRSYPEILQKLTLYLEAGLTVRSAFCRVAEDYEKERKRGGRCREAYEEMLIATREIHMGVPEGAAYENFGKRTGVREYVRLSTFLTQNLKKGSSTLLQIFASRNVLKRTYSLTPCPFPKVLICCPFRHSHMYLPGCYQHFLVSFPATSPSFSFLLVIFCNPAKRRPDRQSRFQIQCQLFAGFPDSFYVPPLFLLHQEYPVPIGPEAGCLRNYRTILRS